MIPSHLFKLDDSKTPEREGPGALSGPCLTLCPCFFRSTEQHSMQVQFDPGQHAEERRNRTVDILTMALSLLEEEIGLEEDESSTETTSTSKRKNADKQTPDDGNSETGKQEVEDKCKEDDNEEPKMA